MPIGRARSRAGDVRQPHPVGSRGLGPLPVGFSGESRPNQISTRSIAGPNYLAATWAFPASDLGRTSEDRRRARCCSARRRVAEEERPASPQLPESYLGVWQGRRPAAVRSAGAVQKSKTTPPDDVALESISRALAGKNPPIWSWPNGYNPVGSGLAQFSRVARQIVCHGSFSLNQVLGPAPLELHATAQLVHKNSPLGSYFGRHRLTGTGFPISVGELRQRKLLGVDPVELKPDSQPQLQG